MKEAPSIAVKPKVDPHVPRNNPKEQFIGMGVAIGAKPLAKQGKWRCEHCTFSNENGATECETCH